MGCFSVETISNVSHKLYTIVCDTICNRQQREGERREGDGETRYSLSPWVLKCVVLWNWTASILLRNAVQLVELVFVRISAVHLRLLLISVRLVAESMTCWFFIMTIFVYFYCCASKIIYTCKNEITIIQTKCLEHTWLL